MLLEVKFNNGKFLCSAVSSKRFTCYTSLARLSNQTPPQCLWEAPCHAAINARKLLVQIYTTVYN